MIGLIGILGFAQITFIPGFLALRKLPLKTNWLEKVIYCFPLSLVINYATVFLLTACHIYTRPVLTVLIASEIGWLFWLVLPMKSSLRSVITSLDHTIRMELQPLISFRTESKGAVGTIRFWLWVACGLLGISAILWGLHVWTLNIGTVFSGWDTLFSWNAYAETWAQNRIPVAHGSYPQLVAANWSISYVLLGSSAIQLFNTLIPPLFLIWTFLMLWDLGITEKESGFFIALIIGRYMIKKLMGDHIFDGYMDVPVMCMNLLVIYTLLKAGKKTTTNFAPTILLSWVFACAAAVTKQTGVYALVIFPIAFVSFYPKRFRETFKKIGLIAVLVFFALVASWYFVSLFRVVDANAGEVVATGIIGFNARYEFLHKLLLAKQSLGIYQYIILFSLIGIFFIPKRLRLPFACLSFPVIALWLFFFTYDVRNMAVAIPFIVLIVGFFLRVAADFVLHALEKFRFFDLPAGILLALFLALLCFVSWVLLPDQKLTDTQITEQKKLFSSEFNQSMLYEPFGETQNQQQILTDYPASYLPKYAECCQNIDFRNTDTFNRKLVDESIRYILMPSELPDLGDQSFAILEQCVVSGKCIPMRCSRDYYRPYCLYEKVN